MRTCSKTIPLAPIHPFTKQMVPSLCPESLTRSLFQLFSPVFRKHPIKCFLPSIPFYTLVVFFFVCFYYFHFHHTPFCGLAGACMNPEFYSNSLFVHSLVCQITHSFLNGFQLNLYQHYLHVYSMLNKSTLVRGQKEAALSMCDQNL